MVKRGRDRRRETGDGTGLREFRFGAQHKTGRDRKGEENGERRRRTGFRGFRVRGAKKQQRVGRGNEKKGRERREERRRKRREVREVREVGDERKTQNLRHGVEDTKKSMNMKHVLCCIGSFVVL